MAINKKLSKEQQDKIVKAIEKAELNTSGEIRVHIENTCKTEPLKRSIEVFEKLKMHQTENRNGVLFYLALNDRKFAVIGDEGINSKVETNFWDDVKSLMLKEFKEAKFVEGLCSGINLAGEKLKLHFPFKTDDTNELSNTISFGE